MSGNPGAVPCRNLSPFEKCGALFFESSSIEMMAAFYGGGNLIGRGEDEERGRGHEERKEQETP
ncbi:MAG: hypothetical protein D6679_11755 [Candidatus Hydrogenedentota bacterium]|nr:MAG: hypothetical protein D6679_11755 [Candidatus Hydrogenedentota bacterium]